MQYVVIIIDGSVFTISVVNFIWSKLNRGLRVLAWLENPQIVHSPLESVSVSLNGHLDVEYVLIVVGYDLADN
jgi:hypothetical protein